MKKFTNRLLVLAALSVAHSFPAAAADLVVGPNRPYQNITDAIAAAADGDRILVMNRTAVYAESPVITKSLTIMSAQEGVYIRVGGTWTFSPAAAGKTLTVMNMNFLSGDITTAANAPAGARSAVRVFGCIMNGNVNFAYSNYDVTVAADSIMGKVSLKFGKVMGNYINSSTAVEVSSDATPTTDSVWVVGNRINGGNNGGLFAVTLNTTSQYVHCTNNLLNIGGYASSSSYNAACGIQVGTSLTSGAGRNSVVNNTVINNSSYGYYGNYYNNYGIYVSNAGLNMSVSNNLLLGNTYSSSNPALYVGGVQYVPVLHNYARTGYSMITGGGGVGNVIGTNTSLNADGTLVAGSDAINGGTPEEDFLDTDLTRNDVGCYGGSLSLANFPRFSNAAGARTFFFQAPRTLMQGQTVKVKASGFDR